MHQLMFNERKKVILIGFDLISKFILSICAALPHTHTHSHIHTASELNCHPNGDKITGHIATMSIDIATLFGHSTQQTGPHSWRFLDVRFRIHDFPVKTFLTFISLTIWMEKVYLFILLYFVRAKKMCVISISSWKYLYTNRRNNSSINY